MDDLKIEVGQQAALDITLQIGELRTVVTVSSADREALDTKSNVIGTVVDSAQVQELPLNGRNVLQLALLAGASVPPIIYSHLTSDRPSRNPALLGELFSERRTDPRP